MGAGSGITQTGSGGEGATPTLEEVLLTGNSTGENTIVSSDGFSALSVQNDLLLMQYTKDDIFADVHATYADSGIIYQNESDGGLLKVEATKTTVNHSALVIINSPIINIPQIPTSPVGLNPGDLWSNLGVLSIV